MRDNRMYRECVNAGRDGAEHEYRVRVDLDRPGCEQQSARQRQSRSGQKTPATDLVE
jgi:hypothetical protein